MFGKAGAPAKEVILAARDRVLARYPKLRVVGCHLGSDEDDLSRLAQRLDAYPNFAVDTAARIRYFARGDRDRAREFLIRYQDRILYATDFSLRDARPAGRGEEPAGRHDRDWAFFSGDADDGLRWSSDAGPRAARRGPAEDLPRECPALAAGIHCVKSSPHPALAILLHAGLRMRTVWIVALGSGLALASLTGCAYRSSVKAISCRHPRWLTAFDRS